MEQDQVFKHAALDFIKYVRRHSLKEKQTILERDDHKIRMNMFRADGLIELLSNQVHIDHVAKIFKDTNVKIRDQNDVGTLLNLLVNSHDAIKLDRARVKL